MRKIRINKNYELQVENYGDDDVRAELVHTGYDMTVKKYRKQSEAEMMNEVIIPMIEKNQGAK